MWQEMPLRTPPDPLSAFQEGLGMRLSHNVYVDLSEGRCDSLTFDSLNLLNLYIRFFMSSVIVYKWKVVISVWGLQSLIMNIIAACKHAIYCCLMRFIASFISKATLSWQKLGPQEPGNNAANTLDPYVPIDTVVRDLWNRSTNNYTCILLGVRPQIQ